MCGIAGFFGLRSPAVSEEIVRGMIGAMHHRGPDGNGVVTAFATEGRCLALGHARLSILDLTDNSRQPMSDSATDSWLVFNGEIYNFAALRGDLEALGYRFHSTGDTEVLLRALIHWGVDALRRIRGMFAIAFWDGRHKSLMLARDPFGIKPLLMGRRDDALLFASELRGLHAGGVLGMKLNPMGVKSALAFGAVIEPATIVEDAIAIPPGHVVFVSSDGRIKPPGRFMGLRDLFDRVSVRRDLTYSDAVRAVEEQLRRSVREQLVSDVPIGVFLSGGIDSSIVAGFAGESVAAKDITYITVSFPEPEFSEIEYAQEIAKRLPGRHEVVQVEAERMLSLLPQALAAVDQPTVDGINTFIISKVAYELGIKVVLSGLGGDELFSGYTTFWKAPILAGYPKVLSLLARLAPAFSFGSESERNKIIRATDCFDIRDTYLLQRSIRWSPESAMIALLQSLPDNALVTPEAWELMSTGANEDSYKRVSYLESVFYMRNQLLRDSDIFSSANSVELRVPFLDVDLLRLAWSLPPSYHRSATEGGKRILKDILRTRYPGLAVHRRKMGFVFPWQRWLRTPPFFQMIADTLNSVRLYHGLGVEPDEGRRILNGFANGNPLVTWSQVWSLFVLLQWSERFQRQPTAA
jgi:asparagine synthase (glutamine-hydrolysing)